MWSKEKFLSDLEFGKIGEEKTLDFLNSLDMTHKVIDVREDKICQKNDVDFIQIAKDCEIYKIEVKTDRQSHISKNIVFEVISNKKYNTEGCFSKCKADIMFYYFSEVDELYYINVQLLKDYVEENKKDLRLVPMGDDALGYLIRYKILLEKEIMFKI